MLAIGETWEMIDPRANALCLFPILCTLIAAAICFNPTNRSSVAAVFFFSREISGGEKEEFLSFRMESITWFAMTARWRKRFIDRLSSVCIPASQEPIMIRDISLLGDLSGPLCHQQQCHRWQCHPLKNWTNKEREKNSAIAGESSQAINSSAMSAWLIATLARKTIAIIVAFSLSNLIGRQEEQQTWCSIEPAWIIPSTYFYTISGVEWKPRRLQFNTHPRFLPFHLTNEYILDYIVYLRNEQWISLPLSHQPVYSDMKGNLRAPIGLVDSWQLEANRECCVCSFVSSQKKESKKIKNKWEKRKKNLHLVTSSRRGPIFCGRSSTSNCLVPSDKNRFFSPPISLSYVFFCVSPSLNSSHADTELPFRSL